MQRVSGGVQVRVMFENGQRFNYFVCARPTSIFVQDCVRGRVCPNHADLCEKMKCRQDLVVKTCSTTRGELGTPRIFYHVQ